MRWKEKQKTGNGEMVGLVVEIKIEGSCAALGRYTGWQINKLIID